MQQKDNQREIFVTCGQGIEPLLLQELGELGFHETTAGYRGIYVYTKQLSDIYKINYCSRLASRVLLPISRFECRHREMLYQNAAEIDWLKFIPQSKTFAIDANVTHPQLKNSLYAALVVKDAICDQFRDRKGMRPDVDVKNSDVQINLFIRDRKAVISIDTSGVPLSKRGYRQDAGEAPLQESLAAALLKIANYQGNEVLFDPCCGSGTLLIEAALQASHTPPGFLRRDWGFMKLPGFSQADWLKIKAEADAQRRPLAAGHFFGCDKDESVIEACKANLRASGFHKEISIQHSDFKNYRSAIPPNFIISNPPHGKRLENVADLIPLYRQLGTYMKNNSAKPARGFIFTGSLELAKEIGLAAKKRHVLANSGVECRFLEFDLY